MLRILPEIVDVPPANRAVRDTILGIQQLAGLFKEAIVTLVGSEFGHGFAVALLDPLEREPAFHLLQPKVGIVEDRSRLGFAFSQGRACHD